MLVWPVTCGISMVGGTGGHLNPSIAVRICFRGSKRYQKCPEAFFRDISKIKIDYKWLTYPNILKVCKYIKNMMVYNSHSANESKLAALFICSLSDVM